MKLAKVEIRGRTVRALELKSNIARTTAGISIRPGIDVREFLGPKVYKQLHIRDLAPNKDGSVVLCLSAEDVQFILDQRTDKNGFRLRRYEDDSATTVRQALHGRLTGGKLLGSIYGTGHNSVIKSISLRYGVSSGAAAKIKRITANILRHYQLDLSGLDLSGYVLFREQWFVEANLTGTNFSRSDLRYARFWKSDIRHCDFTDANLRCAGMGRADARGINNSTRRELTFGT